jgi:phosphoribosylaminoimidazole-succinocarboxamide synthase
MSLKVNEVLRQVFSEAGLILVDAKYEFGMLGDQLVLGDEISPDSCRLWDALTKESLDKDRFRQNLGGVIDSYQEVAARLGLSLPA